MALVELKSSCYWSEFDGNLVYWFFLIISGLQIRNRYL